MTHVAIMVHGGRSDARALGAEVAIWLGARGHEVYLAKSDADGVAPGSYRVDAEGTPLDLVVAIGGDGTVLRAAHRAVQADAALLGINLGELGYLAEVEPDAWEEAITAFLDGRHAIEERLMVSGRSEPGRDLPPALNEVVIEKRADGRTVRLGVSIDGEFFTSYVADGLILATPTGSTAYSLSARGPIVAPSHRALILTPVSPHTLFDRSLILNPASVVEVEVLGDREAVLSIDGQMCDGIPVGGKVTIQATDRPVRFVTFGPRNFHQILKAKFGLGDR